MQFYLKDGPTHSDTHTDVLLKRPPLPEKERRAGGHSSAGYLPMAVQPGPQSHVRGSCPRRPAGLEPATFELLLPLEVQCAIRCTTESWTPSIVNWTLSPAPTRDAPKQRAPLPKISLEPFKNERKATKEPPYEAGLGEADVTVRLDWTGLPRACPFLGGVSALLGKLRPLQAYLDPPRCTSLGFRLGKQDSGLGE